ncbi:hypothetical protein DAEQUDRAFT_293661 [Daedalea quercina L-15889]|uniref:Uncharacterized protein n=1 Tax=Daedalea quercina L-15889 TaxID=1314783 RepID=A0A165TZQ8_9APHY|nr:hypothetical protein DAEQUDRAFT_293661 [Daedalea quercina L-15889]
MADLPRCLNADLATSACDTNGDAFAEPPHMLAVEGQSNQNQQRPDNACEGGLYDVETVTRHSVAAVHRFDDGRSNYSLQHTDALDDDEAVPCGELLVDGRGLRERDAAKSDVVLANAAADDSPALRDDVQHASDDCRTQPTDADGLLDVGSGVDLAVRARQET